MYKNLRYSVPMNIGIISILISLMFLVSCKDFLNPEQDLNLTQDQLFDDYYEYRAGAMGLYGLQQQLVEQLVVLGELRGDLLTVTPNADADLIEINSFQISKTNKYADPTNFYKLISACNNFIRVLKTNHPEIMDKNAPITNYDKLYGEVLCMRAWAYFNAVRIYGKIPVIYESITSIEEIETYLNSTSEYRDTSYIYARDGYNRTKRDTVITLPKQFYDTERVIQVFSAQLESDIKAVGVNHYMDNNDKSWEITVWNTFALHALLGQMYLTSGDLAKSANHLNTIAFTTSDNYRYQLDKAVAGQLWRNIFKYVEPREHILLLRFDKATQQQNDFQRLFDIRPPHQYMLKPTKTAIDLWETVWRGHNFIVDAARPELTKLSPLAKGSPGDSYRGYGTSYEYYSNGQPLSFMAYSVMLYYKSQKDVRSYTTMMDGVDTIVYKYSVEKNEYDQDANFIVYRAGGIQLYLAEIYTWWSFKRGDLVSPFVSNALNIVNDGANYSVLADRQQLGVRGRVGLAGPGWGPYTPIQLGNIIYKTDPYTNEVIGYYNFTNNLLAKQLYLEEQILNERARELAYEGERFYDLIRIAKRRNDPTFLAKKVSAKYPAGQREAIYNYLLDEKNWYINIFE